MKRLHFLSSYRRDETKIHFVALQFTTTTIVRETQWKVLDDENLYQNCSKMRRSEKL